MSEINDKTVAQWLRQKAAALIQAADALDPVVKPGIYNPPKPFDLVPEPNANSQATIENIRLLLTTKAQRVKTLAEHFNVPDYEIERLVDLPDSGVVRGERGWIKLEGRED